MPNELNIALATTGLTVTCQPYQNGAAVGSAISCPETGSTGFYSGNMTGSAGTYQLAFRAAGANVGAGSIIWDGTNEIATSTLTAPQVRTELSTELGRIDANISSRLAPNGTLATVTNLTNAPASVTPSDIWNHATRTLTSASGPTAAQIRTEMDTNSTRLANLDATVSSRLASASYQAPSTPPTAVQIRQEMDSNSTKLANLDAAVSSRSTPANIPASDITAIKAKTDALNTDRLAQVATTNIVGTLLAQANS